MALGLRGKEVYYRAEDHGAYGGDDEYVVRCSESEPWGEDVEEELVEDVYHGAEDDGGEPCPEPHEPGEEEHGCNGRREEWYVAGKPPQT